MIPHGNRHLWLRPGQHPDSKPFSSVKSSNWTTEHWTQIQLKVCLHFRQTKPILMGVIQIVASNVPSGPWPLIRLEYQHPPAPGVSCPSLPCWWRSRDHHDELLGQHERTPYAGRRAIGVECLRLVHSRRSFVWR